MTTKFTELDISSITFGPLQDSVYIPSQKISWITNSTNNARLLIQSPEIITETYGIPQEGAFYTTDKSRAFYKLPFCHERQKYGNEIDYEQIEQFYKVLKSIDDYCGSDEFKAKIFGEKNIGKHEYQPLVRVIEEEDAETNAYRPPYIKIKIDLDFNSGKPTCRVFDKSNGEKKEIAVESLKDLTEHMRFLTKHRFVIHVQRLYSMKTQAGGEKRKYGIGLKLAAVECTNKIKKVENSRFLDLFAD